MKVKVNIRTKEGIRSEEVNEKLEEFLQSETLFKEFLNYNPPPLPKTTSVYIRADIYEKIRGKFIVSTLVSFLMDKSKEERREEEKEEMKPRKPLTFPFRFKGGER